MDGFRLAAHYPCGHGKISAMSAADINTDLMNNFLNAGVEKHTTILLGAGASITSGLPNWDTFVTRLLTESNSVDEESANILLSRQDPLIAVEAARVAASKRWDWTLREALYKGIDSTSFLAPSPLHRETIGHYLDEPAKTSLVTLNFDTLLEQAMEEESEFEPISVTDSATAETKHAVHHLHGVITPNESENVVLTLRDFTSLIEKQDSWQVEYLRAAVRRGALIIAGTSYRDPDLRQWLHKALDDMPVEHKAFVLLARQGFDVTKEEFLKLETALSDQWKAIGLQPILLQDHTDAAQIIRELRYIGSEQYIPPQERCRLLWSAHEQNFQELQKGYVEHLRTDAEKMKNAFDESAIDMTLWLSNGAGQLVRWASQDRIYHNVDTLRVIETGHDSSWIAGQALGADEMRFKRLPDDPTRRWRSVLAIPVPVSFDPGELAAVSSAVLTIGLPGELETYAENFSVWENDVFDIAQSWGARLQESAKRVGSE